jgi:hypothetical protein
MKHYKVFRDQSGAQEAVKQGWSWPAFLFTWVWAFVKRLYALGACVLGGSLVWAIIELSAARLGGQEGAGPLESITHLGGIIIGILFGIHGNSWREKNLLARGYKLQGTVAAESDQAALASAASEEPKNATQPRPSRAGPGAPDTSRAGISF